MKFSWFTAVILFSACHVTKQNETFNAMMLRDLEHLWVLRLLITYTLNSIFLATYNVQLIREANFHKPVSSTFTPFLFSFHFSDFKNLRKRALITEVWLFRLNLLPLWVMVMYTSWSESSQHNRQARMAGCYTYAHAYADAWRLLAQNRPEIRLKDKRLCPSVN